MKCHYEVLGISQDADDSTIKTSYRKLALKHHPDKNMDNPSSKEIFQQIQQAYEVLSDMHERAWYDKHREQILHGNQSNYEDKSLDVFQYFTSSCYDGFEDSNPKNFYRIYGEVFNQIATEDIEYMDDSEHFESIPKFGNSKSDYLEEVEPFYTYFESYSTKKSYAWLFTHNINEIRDRKYLKLIEKEHKKIQQKARKERNEEIRSLVMFVKKRDKRVIEYKKIVDEKLQQNRLKSQQNRLDQIQKRQQEMEDQIKKSKNHEHDAQLKELEKSYFDQYSDSEEDLEDCEEDENLENGMDNLELDDQDLYCIACDKFFSNPSSFKNHEESKKHKQNVSLIKQEMEEEETNFTQNNGSAAEDESEKDESPVKTAKKSKKSKKNKKKQPATVQELVSEEEIVEVKDILQLDSSDKEDSWNDNNKSSKKSKNKKTKTKTAVEKETEPIAKPVPVEKIEKEKPQKKNQKSQKTEPLPQSETVDVDHVCVTCKKTFNSKNKLFNHLKETKHSVFLDKLPAKAGKPKK